jgi:aspartate carbamoyltransferase catalytic subunit
VDELDYALDGDPRAAYFRQASYGVPVRMALVAALLGLKKVPNLLAAAGSDDAWRALPATEAHCCHNPRCITASEPAITAWAQVRADGARRCAYCEAAKEVGA